MILLKPINQLLRAIEFNTGKKVYLVGGAVRDAITNRAPKDFDFVTIGTEQELLSKGWEPTGKAFPVFRHHTFPGVELALGRSEKKVAPGYNGFIWSNALDLKTDLERRDFTCNALAYHPDDDIIDYFHGVDDLKCGILRHVSEAFKEDPNRIFRAARFASQRAMVIANSTMDMMASMGEEIKSAQPEMIRIEMEKAMLSSHPSYFFEVLKSAGCLQYWFPELYDLIPVPAGFPKHHPEGSVFNHSILSMQYAMKITGDVETGIIALVHDFGKGKTDPGEWPKHIGHEKHVESCVPFLKCFNYSETTIDKAKSHMRHHMKFQAYEMNKLRSQTLLEYYRAVCRFIPQHFNVCRADVNGKDKDPVYVPTIDMLEKLFLDVRDNLRYYMKPVMTADMRHAARLQCIKDTRKEYER